MLKRLLLAGLALLTLFFCARFLRRWLASPETRIRWMIEEMEAAYDHGSPGGCVGPLAQDWRHVGYSIDRQLLFGALFQISRERDRETRQLLSRVEVDEDAAQITVEGEHATLTCEAAFSRLHKGAWEESWRARFTAELENRDGDWEVVKSRHQDLRGTHVGR